VKELLPETAAVVGRTLILARRHTVTSRPASVKIGFADCGIAARSQSYPCVLSGSLQWRNRGVHAQSERTEQQSWPDKVIRMIDLPDLD
jgi:hypothetical protein